MVTSLWQELSFKILPCSYCYLWNLSLGSSRLKPTIERLAMNTEKSNLGSSSGSPQILLFIYSFPHDPVILNGKPSFVSPHPLILLGLFGSQVSFGCSQSRLAELWLTMGSSSCGKAWMWQQKASAHTQQAPAEVVQLPELFPPWYTQAQGSSSRLPLIKQMFFKWFMLPSSLISPQKIVSEKPCVIIYSGIYDV